MLTYYLTRCNRCGLWIALDWAGGGGPGSLCWSLCETIVPYAWIISLPCLAPARNHIHPSSKRISGWTSLIPQLACIPVIILEFVSPCSSNERYGTAYLYRRRIGCGKRFAHALCP